MKCEHAEMLMGELLAGEIRPEERADLDRHLMDCATCRLDFEAARSGFRAEWPEVQPSGRAAEAVLGAFRRPPILLRFFQLGTAAAAALLVALLLLGSGGRPKELTPTAAPPAPPRYLASMQEAVVGTLDAKDEDGRPAGELGLQSHVVSVEILDGVAKTTVEENFRNHTDRRLEGTFRFPLPSDASISRLALEVNGKIEEGTCLERERAREVFEGIVRRMKDPALLEWMPGGMFQCRIFPIEPRATKRVIVAYTQALPFYRGTATYHYPLASEKTKTHPPEELRIEVNVRFASELKRIESPSHRLDVQRARPNEARMTFASRNLRPENDFVLTMETADDELRVVPHKLDGDDGYFALFWTPRGAAERKPGRYAFVLDASASVTGPELEVARRVVRAMMEKRIDGDRFEVIAHNVDVLRSGEVDLRAANDFMDRINPIGACDILSALRAAPEESEIVYIGGGTPTYGETEIAKILEAVKGRRIRTIGVGSRVNATLLERLGGHFRISPNDEVGKRCVEIASTLGSDALSEIKVEGGEAVYDVVGVRDIFHGERLVVTGRYRGPAATLVVMGRGVRREIAVTLPPKEEENNYVRRLWAQRKIAELLTQGPAKKSEITELGVKHQIMTPYTSFLVLENEQMWKDHQLKREVQKEDKVLTGAKFSSAEDGKPRPSGGVSGIKGESVLTPEVVKPPPPPPTKPEPRPEPKPEPAPALKPVEAPAPRPVDPTPAPTVREVELMQKLEEHRAKLAKSLNEKSLAVSELEYSRNLAERLSRDLEELEGRHVEYARTRKSLEDRIESIPRPRGGGDLYDAGSDGKLRRSGLSLGDDGGLSYQPGWDGYLALLKDGTPEIPEIFSVTTHVAAPGEPITDPLPVFFPESATKSTEVRKFRSVGDRTGRLETLLGRNPNVPEARKELEKLSEEFAELEGKLIERSREKKHLEDKINAVVDTGTTTVVPRKPLEGKLTAVALEVGLVVCSLGSEAGVALGDEFTVYRGGDFVAKIVVDRLDLKWCSGRIVLKKSDPRVGDDVSNHIFVSAPTKTVTAEEKADASSRRNLQLMREKFGY